MTETQRAELVPVADAPAVGSLHNIRHGVTNEGLLSTVAADVAEELIGVYPWILELDAVAIEQYCRVEARVRMLTGYMDEIVEKKGIAKVPPGLFDQITRAEANAMRAAESLGLTPIGRVKIAKDMSVSKHLNRRGTDDLAERGRALRAKGA